MAVARRKQGRGSKEQEGSKEEDKEGVGIKQGNDTEARDPGRTKKRRRKKEKKKRKRRKKIIVLRSGRLHRPFLG